MTTERRQNRSKQSMYSTIVSETKKAPKEVVLLSQMTPATVINDLDRGPVLTQRLAQDFKIIKDVQLQNHKRSNGEDMHSLKPTSILGQPNAASQNIRFLDMLSPN